MLVPATRVVTFNVCLRSFSGPVMATFIVEPVTQYALVTRHALKHILTMFGLRSVRNGNFITLIKTFQLPCISKEQLKLTEIALRCNWDEWDWINASLDFQGRDFPSSSNSNICQLPLETFNSNIIYSGAFCRMLPERRIIVER